MATKQQQMRADGLSNLAGMSKNQLYDIMSQMKALIEQNQQQARQVLVDNPALTKALFQAQIMLGMVQTPQVIPKIQQAVSQPPQQLPQQGQQPVQSHSLPAQPSIQEQASAPQTQLPVRKQQPKQSLPSMASDSVSPVTVNAQSLPSHSLQPPQHPKGHLNTTPMSLPPSSQNYSIPPPLLHSAPQQPTILQSQVPHGTQPYQSMHSSGAQHNPPQPPFPPQPRPPLMQPFQHPMHSQVGPHQGFQSSAAAHPHHSQPPFSGQPPLPSQPPPQSVYQMGSSHLGPDYNSQGGNPMQADRASWMPGLSENAMGGAPNPGQPPLPGHMGPTSQPPRPPQLSQEMEKAILQQVMSLSPEQINLLPPEQRHQVLQLQQMLRQ